MKAKAKKNRANTNRVEDFESYYKGLYGDRWLTIKESLLHDGQKIQLASPFIPTPLEPYELDPASLYVARCLDVQPGETVLDLCSAPGGKSLCLLYLTKGDIELSCNELSLTRFKRLKRVMREHLPEDVYQKIRFSNRDGQRWGLQHAESYDRVLLDAPCSGERHLLENKKELSLWSLKRAKGLHQRQVALLCAAFDSLRPGGRLIYSTCSLNPLENDKTIEVLLKKRSQAKSRPLPHDVPAGAEPTTYGTLILPLETKWGPMFCAKISKDS